MAQLSIIVCTYNRAFYLEKCLASFTKQTAPEQEFEVIVVDNNSSDNTAELVSSKFGSYPFIKYFKEFNQGLSHARNRGIKEAQGKYISFIDDDAEAIEPYVENIINTFRDHQNIKAFGGKTTPSFESAPPRWLNKFLVPLYAQVDLGDQIIPMKKSQFPVGANMVFRAELLPKENAFDVNLGRKGENLEAGEEKDLFNGLKAQGITPYYVPSAKVIHLIPDKRLSFDYIKKQAEGTGKSERIRTKREGTYGKRALMELFKWGASFALLFFYLLTFRGSKGVAIIKFRYWVSSKFFKA